MIEKLNFPPYGTQDEWINKINELVDAVNTIQKEREAERFEIQEWIGILEAVRKSVNIHEKQIDELQITLEPEKCETRAENVQPYTETRSENVPDLDIQLSWIGYLCRFWDYDKIESTYAILDDINVWCEHPYRKSNGNQYKHCEPVKPDDDIIFKE